MKIADHHITVSGRILKIAQPKYTLHEHIENPEVFLNELVTAKIGADIFTFWQTLPDTKPLYNYHFDWDNVAAIPVHSYDEWLNKQVSKNTRKNIKKASKIDVFAKEVHFDDAFCACVTSIYNETSVRRGRHFGYYGKDAKEIQDGLSDQLESSVFLGAFCVEELIGYIKLILMKTYVRATGTLTSTLHRDKPAMNVLIAKAVEYCAMHNYPFLVYGRYIYGNKGADSLTDFKWHNGFEKFDIPRYYIPMTAKGRLSLRFGLHRELTSLLPSNLYRYFITLRAKYYTKSASDEMIK